MGLAGLPLVARLSRVLADWPSSFEAGIVGVNNALPSVAFAPMGGVKQSGLGREGAALGPRGVRGRALPGARPLTVTLELVFLPLGVLVGRADAAGHRRRFALVCRSAPRPRRRTVRGRSSFEPARRSSSRRSSSWPAGGTSSGGRRHLLGGARAPRRCRSVPRSRGTFLRPRSMVVIGLLVVVALGAVAASASGPASCVVEEAPSPPARSSGFMNVTAGVGGPAIILYAVSTAWEHRTVPRDVPVLHARRQASPRSRPRAGCRRCPPTELLLCLGGLGARARRRPAPCPSCRPRDGTAPRHRAGPGQCGRHGGQGRPHLVNVRRPRPDGSGVAPGYRPPRGRR